MMRRQHSIPGRERMRWRRLNEAPIPEPAADPMADVLATMAQRMPEFLAMPARQLRQAERQAEALERISQQWAEAVEMQSRILVMLTRQLERRP